MSGDGRTNGRTLLRPVLSPKTSSSYFFLNDICKARSNMQTNVTKVYEFYTRKVGLHNRRNAFHEEFRGATRRCDVFRSFQPRTCRFYNHVDIRYGILQIPSS
eukprot:1196304-Prorocentrum_minimum.AAC.5